MQLQRRLQNAIHEGTTTTEAIAALVSIILWIVCSWLLWQVFITSGMNPTNAGELGTSCAVFIASIAWLIVKLLTQLND